MGTDLVIPDLPDSDESFGPAMRRCTPLQRRFVQAILITGGRNQKRCALIAGYKGNDQTLAVTGFRVAHTPYVQAAILEEASKRLGGAAIDAVSTVLDILNDPKTSDRDRLHAAQMVNDRVGLHAKTEHTVNVTNDIGPNSTMLAAIKLRLKTNPDFLAMVPEPIRLLLAAEVNKDVDKTVDAVYMEVDTELEHLMGD